MSPGQRRERGAHKRWGTEYKLHLLYFSSMGCPSVGEGSSRGKDGQLGFGEVVGGRGMRRLLNRVANGQLLGGRPEPKVADPTLRAGTLCPVEPPGTGGQETWRPGLGLGAGRGVEGVQGKRHR